jgi:hypothetical protein
MTRPPLPDEALRVNSASINSFLRQERNGDITLGYGFEIEFHPFFRMEEGDADENEDEDEEDVPVEKTCRLTFQSILNGARNWKEIGGSFAYGRNDNNAFIDFGPGSESHPVDVCALTIQHLAGCEFRVSADFNLLLEIWGSGYADRTLHLDFDATFKEMTIQMHNFTEDSGIKDLAAFLPRHVDMDCYQNPRVVFESLAIIEARPD